MPRVFQPGWWAVLALCLLAALGAYGDISRLRNPFGEKLLPVNTPGQNDFVYVYVSARALVAGVNPYRNNRREFNDPFSRIWTIDGVRYKQLYPPAHVLIDVPLALWKGADWEAAARVWFHASLLALVALAALVWSMARRVTEAPLTPLWIPFILTSLLFNLAVEFGLERGQSDVFSALLGWTAVWCFLRSRRGLAVFLAICGAALKAYLVPFAAGLCLLGWRRRDRKAVVVGVLAALAVTVLPVIRYYPDGMRAMLYRSDMFWASLENQGFLNAVYQLRPAWARTGRLVLTGFAVLVSLLAWVQTRRAYQRGLPASQALWLVVYATASLALMIGYSSLSVSYNLILVLPGLLILVISQQALALPRWAAHAVGLTLLCVVFSFGFIHTGVLASSLAIAGYGLVALLVVLGGVLGRALARPFERL